MAFAQYTRGKTPEEVYLDTFMDSQEASTSDTREPSKLIPCKKSRFLEKFNAKLYWFNDGFNYKGRQVTNEIVGDLLRKHNRKTRCYVKPKFEFYNPMPCEKYYSKQRNKLDNEQSDENVEYYERKLNNWFKWTNKGFTHNGSLSTTEEINKILDDLKEEQGYEFKPIFYGLPSVDESFLDRVNDTLVWSNQGFLRNGEICPIQEINEFLNEIEQDCGFRVKPILMEVASENGENDANENDASENDTSQEDTTEEDISDTSDENNSESNEELNENNSTEYCEKQTQSESLYPLLPMQNKLTCKICKNQFSSSSSLTRHFNSIHNSQRFDCPKCEKQFARVDILTRHIRMCTQVTS
jgi:hypothetical protein